MWGEAHTVLEVPVGYARGDSMGKAFWQPWSGLPMESVMQLRGSVSLNTFRVLAALLSATSIP